MRLISHHDSARPLDDGPDYRVDFTFNGKAVILVLCGGDKSSQSKDIERALDVAAHWEGSSVLRSTRRALLVLMPLLAAAAS